MKNLIKTFEKSNYLVLLLFISLFINCKEEVKTTTTRPSGTTTVNTGKLTSKMTKADKKKYYNSDNTVVYEVKYKDDSFKLRSSSSDLLWKIKLYENKVKISDNEENLNPYEIKKMENGESKLEKDDTTIERSTASNARNLISKITEIPLDQQEILINELKAKGF
ncbi:MAG: hypothetical protein AB8B59_15460 [Maribacter sp.]